MTRTDDSEVPDYPGMLRMDGRGVVVIGAGQGIGRQTSHALAQAGATVCCVDLDAELAEEIAGEVGGVPWTGNATVRADAERLFAEAPGLLAAAGASGLGGVVDIVGMAQYRGLLDMDDELWDWHHDIVLRHAYLAVQLGGTALRDAGGGVMVFVASASGLTAAPRHAAYGAAKAGLIGLVRSAAVELGPLGIRVNAVAPGLVWTPRVSGYLGDKGKVLNSANSPLERVALPQDIAAAIVFLASDLSAYVNGQVLSVDGGVGVKFPYPVPENL
jgi:NAD(P)-dependent dehydrogenase (short-subunit alcohol dehydrogenase family)